MDISIEYLAGFFDGEGCVNIGLCYHKTGRRFTQLKVIVTNTDRSIIQACCAQFNARFNSYQHPTKNDKQVFKAIWTGPRAIEILKVMRPALRIKQPQADLAFKFWDFYKQDKSTRYERTPNTVRNYRRTQEFLDKEYEFYLTMKVLNKRGKT